MSADQVHWMNEIQYSQIQSAWMETRRMKNPPTSMLSVVKTGRTTAGPTSPRIDAAMENAKTLLKQFRDVGQPVVHIQHQGKAGGAFDLDDPRGAIDDRVAPVEGETVIRKALPNSFANTNLQEILEGIGRQKLVIAGFQTHMCVSATTRAALDLGYRNTLVADAIATRDLPGPGGGGVVAALSGLTMIARGLL